MKRRNPAKWQRPGWLERFAWNVTKRLRDRRSWLRLYHDPHYWTHCSACGGRFNWGLDRPNSAVAGDTEVFFRCPKCYERVENETP